MNCRQENVWTHSKVNKFCNNKCQVEYQGRNKVNQWLAGKTSPSLSIVRRYLNETKGYKCDVCNLSEWRGEKLTLEVDHIDGNPFNNDHTNFRYICPNCHSQTPSYKGANRGNGRPKAQKDYTIIRSLS